MATNNKNFKVKNGLNVNGTATFNSDFILNGTQIAFDTQTNRLKVYVNNAWVEVANLADAQGFSFEDIGVSVDYDGNATYIVQGNGITPSGTSKFADGGIPSSSTFRYIFDGGVLA
jgi:hypothetical protein